MLFLTMEQSAHNCDQFAKWFWHHPTLKMQEVYGIVKIHRDHKDYSGMGYTQKEIGEILVYSNHSGVNKRIKYIKHEFQKFRSEENEYR